MSSPSTRITAHRPGERRLTVVRALLGGGASAALLPWIIGPLGGDSGTCLRLGALFGLAALATEIPAARFGDRLGRARPFLVLAAMAQTIGLLAIARAASLPWVAFGVVLTGVGAGLATGAEARASLAIGRDARRVARIEIAALLYKGTLACVLAGLAIVLHVGVSGAMILAAAGTMLAGCLASTLRVADRVHRAPSGRRTELRAGDRRSLLSAGTIGLVGAICALGIAARGTDTIDAYALVGDDAARASLAAAGMLACAGVLAAKGVMARILSAAFTHARLLRIAIGATLAAAPLLVASHLSPNALFVILPLACGTAAAAAAAARGVLLSRAGASRAGFVSAIESTLRRVGLGVFALAIGNSGQAYFCVGVIALIGAAFAMIPRLVPLGRRLRGETESPISSRL